MNDFDFFRQIGSIDETLVIAADEASVQRKQPIFKYGIMAASFVAVLICGVFFIGENTGISNSPDITGTQKNTQLYSDTTAEQNYELYYNHTETALGKLLRIPGHFWQELSGNEKSDIFGGLEKKYNINAKANYSKENERISIFDICAEINLRDDLSIMVKASPTSIVLCYLFDTDDVKETVINGVSVRAGRYDKGKDGKPIYFASFKKGDVFYYAETSCVEEDERFFSKLIYDMTESKEADFSVLNPVAPELMDQKMSLAEAFTDEKFGEYIPKNVPGVYSFEEAHRFINQEYDYLSVLWCHNYDDIRFKVSYITEQDKKRITKTSETKNYDFSLYPIPLADSVPEELFEIVYNPIFSIDDLTLDTVKKRVIMHNEEGNEKKITIRLGVLYDEKYLVTVDTSGISPEELYGILTELGK